MKKEASAAQRNVSEMTDAARFIGKVLKGVVIADENQINLSGAFCACGSGGGCGGGRPPLDLLK